MPELSIDDAWIQCGRFRGLEKVNIFDQIELHEHLPQAVEDIELFLKKHAFKSAEFGGMRRIDHWSIPVAILREVIINALVHCDYSQRGSPIRVAFYDDRIEVESPGLLMPGLTLEEMKSGVSIIRNPVIARIFRELELIEQWGSGVKRIFALANEQGLPEPRIEEIFNRLRVTVYLAERIAISGSHQEPVTLVQPESRPESDLALALMQALLNQPLGKAEIAKSLGHDSISGYLKQQTKLLQQQEFIEMTLPEKPNSRLQKYRLTQKGIESLPGTGLN